MRVAMFCGLIFVIAGAVAFLVFSPGGTRYSPGEVIADTEGVENVVVFGPDVLSGAQPEGAAGFDTLAAMGVKSIVSVDAARPDIELASERGMRYVHVPIKYSGIEGSQRLAIAKAIRDLPKPVFVHCHHGKHRGPAAAAIGLVSLGDLTPEEAVAMMHTAGTSENYDGLYRDVSLAVPLSAPVIDAGDDAPEVAIVTGLAATMIEIDQTFGEINAIANAGWVTPDDHPDLELEHAAPRLPDLFRMLAEDLDLPDNAHVDAGYREQMNDAAEEAARLEAAIAEEDWTSAESLRSSVAASCVRCHDAHR